MRGLIGGLLVAGLAWGSPGVAEAERLVLEPAAVELTPGEQTRFRAYLVQPDGRRQRARVEFSPEGGQIGPGGDFVAGAAPGRFTLVARTGVHAASAEVKVARGKARAGVGPVGAGPALVLKSWKQPTTAQVRFEARIARGTRLEVLGVRPDGGLHPLQSWSVKAGEPLEAQLPVLPGAYVALAVHLVDAKGRRLAEHRERLRR